MSMYSSDRSACTDCDERSGGVGHGGPPRHAPHEGTGEELRLRTAESAAGEKAVVSE